MKQLRIFKKSLYLWIRELHLYVGMFISPFILVFAISTILFNHTWKPWGDKSDAKVQKTSASIEIPKDVKGGAEGIEQAKQILRQVGVSGEINYIRHLPGENRLVIPVMKPGQEITINVDLKSQTAEIKRRYTDIWDALFYLHKSPGAHNANIRGNWFYTRLWGWLADTVVYLILFISISGIYMWAVIKAERKIGLILLGAGCLSFILMIAAFFV
jgi:hypothetical protein